MLYSITGRLVRSGDSFLIVETAGLGLKVFVGNRTREKVPPAESEIKLFSYLYLREEGLELYGFLTEQELRLFELLNSVSGVGPKSALAILDIADFQSLSAAIKEGRPDLLTRASGIGRRTAERIILELKSRVLAPESGAAVKKMEGDADIVETLVGLGYRRDEAKRALENVDAAIAGVEARLKAALKSLTRKL